MNNITKYNIKTSAVATIAIILLICLFSYASAPQSASFFDAINPITALAGLAFTLAYVGASLVISIIVTILIVTVIWFLFLVVARRIFK